MSFHRFHAVAGMAAVVCTVGATGAAFALNDAADTFYWTGAQDAFWTNANNWVCSDGTTVASTAPGVAGALSETDAWIGHRGDTAVFDGTRFAAGAANVLDLDGLLCVGNVTVQGAETPVIQFGTEAVDSQALRLYATSGSDTGVGVFTVASDVVNMPVIMRPAVGGLIDGEHGNNVSMYWKNEVSGKTLRFPGMAAETKNDTNAHYLHHYLTGAGSFIFDGNINRDSQYNLHYEPSGPGSLTFTNFTKTVTRFYAATADDVTNTVYIAEGSRLYTECRGSDQLLLGGNLRFEGMGTLCFLDHDGTGNPPASLTKNSYLRFDVKVIHGSNSISTPSQLEFEFNTKQGHNSTFEFNNPENVFDGGVKFCGTQWGITVGHCDALGQGTVTLGGKPTFRYTGDAAIFKNAITNVIYGGYLGIVVEHAGNGRLVLEGGVGFQENWTKGTSVKVQVNEPDAELEIFGGIEDRSAEGAEGMNLQFHGVGRTIVHGPITTFNWMRFGNETQEEMTKITFAPDVTFHVVREGKVISFRKADVTFEGLQTGPVITRFLETVSILKENIFRFVGRRSLNLNLTSLSQAEINVFRENPDQQLFMCSTNANWLIPGDGSEITWVTFGEKKKTSEYLLDCSFRPYTGLRNGLDFRTTVGVAANGGVFPSDDPDARVSLSPDGMDATGPATLAAEGLTSVSNLIQKGRMAAVVAMAEGQSLYTGGIIGIDDEAADLTIGDKIGVGTVRLHPVNSTHICNLSTEATLTVNAAIDTTAMNLNVKGPGAIVLNGPLTGPNGLTMDGPTNLTVYLNGANTHQGQIFVWSGRMIIGSENVFPPGSNIRISDKGILDLNGIIPDVTDVPFMFTGNGHIEIGADGWVFTAGTPRDFSAIPVNVRAGEAVTIVNAAEVAAGKRSVYTLARFMDPQTVDPEMDQTTQAALGPKWNLEWNSSRTALRLCRPCGFSIVIR